MPSHLFGLTILPAVEPPSRQRRSAGHVGQILGFLALVCMCAPIAQAQSPGVVRGRVTNTEGQAPIVGASVDLGGGQFRVLTGESGSFEVPRVPPGTYVLRVRYLGMRPETRTVAVTAGATVSVDIQMTAQPAMLEQVFVTGTAGGAREREIGNSIARINRADATDLPVNTETMLQAQAPGISVMQNSSQIGGSAEIRLRGVVSASMSNQPLVFIDGVRVRSEPYPNPSVVGARSNNENQSPLNDISPDDIDHVEIIRGAAASTLYGTEAAAGVIQIFTKHGQAGRTVWTAETQQGFEQEQPFGTPAVPYFYLDPWLKNGGQHQYTLSVQGGAQQLRYFASYSAENGSGVLPDESLKRNTARGNMSFSPTKSLVFDWNSSYTDSHISNVAGGVNPSGFITEVMRQTQNHLGSADPAVESELLNQEFLSGIDRLISGLTTTYTPMPNWSTRLELGYDWATNLLTQLQPFGFINTPTGYLSLRNFQATQRTADLSSTLHFTTGKFSHQLSVGGQFTGDKEMTMVGTSTNFAGPGAPTLSSGSIQSNSEVAQEVITGGVFAQDIVGFRDRLFVTLGMRIDGSSAFGSGFGLQRYPKVSASYVISDESFWHRGWGDLKLRGALGEAGRAPGAFDAVRTWTPVRWGSEAAYLPANVGDADLGPERSLETELGFDWSVVDHRVTVNFTAYHGKTEDALIPVPSIPSTGFQNSQLRNVGTIQNRGTELAVNWEAIRTPGWGWSIGTNVATNESKVLSLGGAPAVNEGNNGYLIEGEPLFVLRGVKLMNPNAIADPVLDSNYVFGPNNPTLIVGLNTSVTLPGHIRLSAVAEYQHGAYETDGATDDAASKNIRSWPTCVAYDAMVTAGTQDQATARQRLDCNSAFYQPGLFIQSADFAKLRSVSAQIPVPVRRFGLSSAALTLSLHNWFRWVNSDFPLFDPETMGASSPATQTVRATGVGVLPPPRTFTASLRVVF